MDTKVSVTEATDNDNDNELKILDRGGIMHIALRSTDLFTVTRSRFVRLVLATVNVRVPRTCCSWQTLGQFFKSGGYSVGTKVGDNGRSRQRLRIFRDIDE